MAYDVRQMFRTRDLRCTRQRSEVYAALAQTKTHPTADELHTTLPKGGCSISLATVYNTLEALCRGGMCRKLTPSTGPARFDADTSDHVHILVDDGRIIDAPHELNARLTAGLPPELVAELERQLGMSIGDVAVSVHAATR
jgi:Fe2+ or Zn2+ uptake regulation protein